MGGRHFLASGSALAAICLAATPLQAQTTQRYDIAEQDLAAALKSFTATSGREVVAASTVIARKHSVAVRGDYPPEAALRILLSQADLRADVVEGAFVIRPLDVADAKAPQSDNSEADIVVTGSRIRGAPVASPVIVLGRQAILDSGRATLPDALRALPQNFGGGQNPGIGFNVPESNGGDVGGGSSINLRGLGGDATLTLLNGRRLSYNAAKQSVDISAIPFGAVGRVDVVPDGASALFGSDAVAGVVNVVLRRDLDGFETTARLGGASDGGYFTQSYAATGGQRWRTGDAMLAYEYGSTGAITADQRDYAATRSPGLTLYPFQRHHSVLASGHQQIGGGFELAVDGLFNKRWTDLTYPLAAGGDLTMARGSTFSIAQSYGLSPSLSWTAASGWNVVLAGTFGQDRVDYGGETFQNGVRSVNTGGYYRNRARSIELSANGSLFALPGGPAKIALGGGYRQIDFRRFTGVSGTQNIDRSQGDSYAFGELSLPVVGGDRKLPLVDRLVLSAAVRYENYPGIGDVATPKLGLIYAPISDVTLKGSWGKSFRAPTLYQQYQPQTLYLTRITTVGGQGYPATATALLLLGGNPALKPERSTNWSVTLDIHPRAIEGLGLEISYFSVRYRDRIVTPIPSFSAALRNAGYASFVTFNPSAADQAALIAGAGTFTNLTGGAAYLPANVAALVRNTSLNAGRQSISGIDGVLRYKRNLGGGTITAAANAAYLESDQQIGPTLPITELAGIIFNPPHLRLRGDLSWSIGAVTLTGNVTRIGAVTDNRAAVPVRIAGMTPVDFTLRYRTDTGIFGGIDIVASAQNLFNAKPSPIATTLFYDTPYDSTNYSPVGRFINLSVTKKW